MHEPGEPLVTICHLSDLHLPLEGLPAPWHLFGKRSLGFANLVLSRGSVHQRHPLTRLLDRVARESADLVVISGDLTNLALSSEFVALDRFLGDAGLDPRRTMIVPGNHDRYAMVADRLDHFEHGLARWLPAGFRRDQDYPLTRIMGPVVVLGLDTAVWRSPIRAAGRIERGQLERLLAVLRSRDARGLWPIIVMHHPPFPREGHLLENWRNGTDDPDLLVRALIDRPATVLHGHLHRAGRRRIGRLEIIGAPSASSIAAPAERRLAYHRLVFSRAGLVRGTTIRIDDGDPEHGAFVETPLLPHVAEDGNAAAPA